MYVLYSDSHAYGVVEEMDCDGFLTEQGLEVATVSLSTRSDERPLTSFGKKPKGRAFLKRGSTCLENQSQSVAQNSPIV